MKALICIVASSGLLCVPVYLLNEPLAVVYLQISRVMEPSSSYYETILPRSLHQKINGTLAPLNASILASIILHTGNNVDMLIRLRLKCLSPKVPLSRTIYSPLDTDWMQWLPSSKCSTSSSSFRSLFELADPENYARYHTNY